jgi:carboxylesterase type B
MKINIQQFLGIDYSISSEHQRWHPSILGVKLSKKTDLFGPIAPQLPSISPISSATVKPLKQSENCLNLNIFISD